MVKLSKSTTFRKNLLKRVERKLASGQLADHPIMEGIHMQAHHLISGKAVKDNGMKTLLKKVRGYDINHAKNLVFLPCTLPGACHLEVQVHRGDHVFSLDDDMDDDEVHANSYHKFVRRRLKAKEKKIRNCDSDSQKSVEETYDLLNKVSKEILLDIEDFDLPLTKISESFESGNEVGCGNCVDVNEHFSESRPCKPYEKENSPRNHFKEFHAMYKSGTNIQKITIWKKNYKLRPGK